MALDDFVDRRDMQIADLQEALTRATGGGAGAGGGVGMGRDFVPNPSYVKPAKHSIGGFLGESLDILAKHGEAMSGYNARARLFTPFWYTTPALTLASGGTLTGIALRVDNDSYFICTALHYHVDLPAAAAPAFPDTTIVWTRQGSGALMMSAPTPVQAICNITTLANVSQAPPSPWQQPVIWVPSDTMSFDLNDTATGVAQVLRISAVGFKFYVTAGGAGFGAGG